MECDRDMNAVDCKSDVDLPSGWVDVFRNACKNPTPFNVILHNAASFLNYTAHLKLRYKSTCPFKTSVQCCTEIPGMACIKQASFVNFQEPVICHH